MISQLICKHPVVNKQILSISFFPPGNNEIVKSLILTDLFFQTKIGITKKPMRFETAPVEVGSTDSALLLHHLHHPV